MKLVFFSSYVPACGCFEPQPPSQICTETVYTPGKNGGGGGGLFGSGGGLIIIRKCGDVSRLDWNARQQKE